jgi:UDP-glucose 4-epimerase
VSPGDTSSLAGRRVLVTGGSGFIGRHVVEMLQAAGAHPRVLDLEAHADPEIEIVRGDIAEAADLEAAFDGGIDLVVHLAAVTSVLRSVEQPEETYRTNVLGTHRLLAAAQAAGASALAFASTNAVVGPMGDAPAITERSVPAPLTPYGATKAAGEMLMSAATASYGLRCAPLRLTNVYGLGMQAKDSIIARLMRAVRLGSGFEIYGDGTQVRDYVNVADVARAFGRALADERWAGPTVIGAADSRSVLEVVEAVREASGAALKVTHGPAKPGEMPAVIVDTARARTLGWSPATSFETGIAAVWDEWRAAAVPVPAGAR